MTATGAGAAFEAAPAPANRRMELTGGVPAVSLGVAMVRTANAVKSGISFAFAAPIRMR